MGLVELKNRFLFGENPGIYVLFVESLVYVGSSLNVYMRISAHRTALRRKTFDKERIRLQSAYNRKNENSYEAKIFLCEKENLDKYEKEMTLKYKKSHGNKCVNVSFGKDHSPETIEKLRKIAKGNRGGTCNGNAKVNWEDILNIRKLSEEGIANVKLAERYGLSKVSISHIITHKTWRACDMPEEIKCKIKTIS